MFKVAVSPKYWQTVEAVLPGENGGQQNVKFEVQFHRLDTDGMERLQERLVSEKLSDRDVAREVMCGFRGVADEDGAEMTYSDESRDMLLNAGLGTAIVLTFFRSQPKAKQKN